MIIVDDRFIINRRELLKKMKETIYTCDLFGEKVYKDSIFSMKRVKNIDVVLTKTITVEKQVHKIESYIYLEDVWYVL